MTVKGYPTLPRSLELEPHHLRQFAVISKTLLCKGCSQRFQSSNDREGRKTERERERDYGEREKDRVKREIREKKEIKERDREERERESKEREWQERGSKRMKEKSVCVSVCVCLFT